MRRIAPIPFGDRWLMATFDGPADATEGWLFVVGGRQTRIGPHRLYERLAARLAGEGQAVIRFDRRGVGDSPPHDDDPGYLGSAPDIAAAAAALREAFPEVEQVRGFGLCDGATALALHGGALGIGRLVLANPWVVAPTDDLPPAAAIRGHYARRMLDPSAWSSLLRGKVDFARLARGMARSTAKDDISLAERFADCLPADTTIVLAEGDGTAQAFDAAWRRLPAPPAIEIVHIPTSSHSFAGDDAFSALSGVLTRRR